MQIRSPKKAISLALRLAGCLGLAVCVAVLAAARPGPRTAPGAVSCADCHEDQVKAFARNPHAATGENACASCHAGAAKHMEEGGGANLLAFKATELPGIKNNQCLTCHAKDQSAFMAGPHGLASMDCGSCHSIHGGQPQAALLKEKASKVCAACHQDVMAKFQLNERHRLQEGVLECTSCHDAHAPQAGAQSLGGFKQEVCLKCHTDKGGPFLYEHGSSRVEGCTSCHEPHGSVGRHMLTTQSVPDLCFGCHVMAPSWHSQFDAKSSNCTSCHATIHGSNLSKIFLK